MNVIINEQSNEVEDKQEGDVQHTYYNKNTRQFEQYTKSRKAGSKSEVSLFGTSTVMFLKDVVN